MTSDDDCIKMYTRIYAVLLIKMYIKGVVCIQVGHLECQLRGFSTIKCSIFHLIYSPQKNCVVSPHYFHFLLYLILNEQQST